MTQWVDQRTNVASIAKRLMECDFKCWFFGDSIGFEGLLAAGDLLEDNNIPSFMHGFFRAWVARIKPFLEDDNTAPGHVMCAIFERTHDETLRRGIIDLAVHLRTRRKHNGISITFEDSRRSLMEPYGDVQLSENQKDIMKDPGPGIYVDCMHFDPPFFAHLAHIDPDGEWGTDAIAEILGYRDLLVDPSTGLYCHFWLERQNRAYTRGWGRGQGWALLGLVDVLRSLGRNTPRWNEVYQETIRIARTMVRYQQDDGNWYCLVHDERSGPEASTAAFMATAFFRGMSSGLLSKDEFLLPAQRAFEAMCYNLNGLGILEGVSAAVYSALVEEHYWHVPLNQIVPWGQGPVLTALLAQKQYLDGQE